MNIRLIPLSQIVPYARNARVIPPAAVDKVAASIKENKWRQPIVVDKDFVIIVGHVRYLAAQKLGFEQVPVHIAEDLTPRQVRAYRLMDNRSHEETAWNQELLTIELGELKDLDSDLSLTGFDPLEIDRLLGQAEGDMDEVPPLPEQAVSSPGDVWLLGAHRLLCGDATDGETVQGLLNGADVKLMITDPPYGVDYDPEWRERAGLGRQRQRGKVANDTRVDWSAAYRLFPGDAAYVWHAGLYAAEVAASLEAAGFQMRGQIIWAKQHFALSRGHYHWQHEPAWYAVRRDRPAHWRGDRTQSTLWQVGNLNPFGGSQEAATGHGTQKPVELMRKPILNHLEEGEIVYDPFLGSGTTLVAAESLQRVCYAVEIDARYVDVAIERWQTLKGEKALLAGSGSTFEEMGKTRGRDAAAKI